MQTTVGSIVFGPRDQFVLTTPKPISREVAERLRQTWDEARKAPEKLLIIEQGMELTVLRPQEETSMTILAGLVS